ncbi:MAG: hypothetical protein JSV66_04695 [Trueperaceae bacterium]|nr:MAG: hypothetical protein JSV66_04695 [Trueperaceae bacterium]
MKKDMASTVIELSEYQTVKLPHDTLPPALGESLWRDYGKVLSVEFPSPKTDRCWALSTYGTVGYIPLATTLGLMITPRAEVDNLFHMLEVAYGLEVTYLQALYEVDTLHGFFNRLAYLLAGRVLERCRKGLYRAYVSRKEALTYLRGSLDLQRQLQTPWQTHFNCNFQEQTSDVEDNRILTWTLFTIARNGLCTGDAERAVRKAYRTLQTITALEPFDAKACQERLYNRLNYDYRDLHLLCRFFLENCGPRHALGSAQMLAFLVDMPRLFELFVAEWLKQHLPTHLTLTAQEHVEIDAEENLSFTIDLVLYHAHSGETLCIIDTKYKSDLTPSTADISQVVAYAQAKRCQDAVLIYPSGRRTPRRTVGDTRVHALTFALDGELNSAGEGFLAELLRSVPSLSLASTKERTAPDATRSKTSKGSTYSAHNV